MTITFTGGVAHTGGIKVKINRAPVWTSSGSLGDAHESITITAAGYTLVATDADASDTLTYSFVSGTLPTGASIQTDGQITGPAVAVGSPTTFNFVARVSDGTTSVDQALSITVNNNVAPVWQTGATLPPVDGNTAINTSVEATDVDGLPVAVTYSNPGPNFLPVWLSLDANTGALTGTTPGLASDTPFVFDLRASDGLDTVDRQFSLTVNEAFVGGNVVENSVLDFTRIMATGLTGTPVAGGTLTINGGSLGSYDYVIKDGNQTVSSFSATDWFTTTQDSRAAFVVVKGNLTINAGQTFIPGVRKLFTVVYVTGDLSVNGDLSMTRRGANHSGTGSNIAASAIRIANGTFSSVTNPQVPAAGANGGSSRSRNTNGESAGNAGSTGTAGATGGGGSGGVSVAASFGPATSGAGSPGTSFSGGSGGGGASAWECSSTAQAGATNGGKGGNANSCNSSRSAGGGAGNPGGSGIFGGGTGAPGTGGVLVIIVEGNLSGNGTITAAGGSPGGGLGPGGGSGGGSVTTLQNTDSSTIVPTALGPSTGGNGTARKLTL